MIKQFKLIRLQNNGPHTQAQIIRTENGEIVVTATQLSVAKRSLKNLNEGLHASAFRRDTFKSYREEDAAK